MEELLAKFATLWPEIALFVGAVACLITGLSKSLEVRQRTVWIAGGALVAAGLLVPVVGRPELALDLGGITVYAKLTVVFIGLILLMVIAGVPGQLRQSVRAEGSKVFHPSVALRGEFYAFFLFCLMGVMITAGSDDLVWLFLALELTSLPTYVMVAISRDRIQAQESAVKYFFLGALAVAVFLYGFALIYGATGHTSFTEIHAVVQHQLATTGTLSPLLMTGIVLAIVGISFKITAVPMHFYAADVYQGAHTAVTALLAFVPKFAGFLALIFIVSLVGWENMPAPLMWLLWIMAALTMTLGNVLALLQNSVKRVLAYSSVAHSGYALVGLVAGPAVAGAGFEIISNGLAAILFYMVAYALGTIPAFAVLGLLRSHGEEIDTFEDLAGIRHRYPALAAIMVVSMISLLGLPPLVGFIGKIFILGSAISAGFVGLAILLVLNSAVSAAYYLRIASACIFGEPSDDVSPVELPSRRIGAAVAAFAAVALGFLGTGLVDQANQATSASPTLSPQAEESTQATED